MNEMPDSQPVTPDEFVRPWSLRDTWFGLALLVIILAPLAALSGVIKSSSSFLKEYGPLAVIINELIILIPVVIILIRRQADWRLLGFRKFHAGFVGLGCSFVIIFYLVTLVNNLIFLRLGWPLQSDEIKHLLRALPSPYSFFFTAMFLAPLVEETFFRGFLFAGFRQRYGWNRAALLSSGFFAVAHLIPAAMIPAFVVGVGFAYLYHKSNSLWPGIFMHFLINSFAVILVFLSLYRA